MDSKRTPDFDGDALRLVEDAYQISKDFQYAINEQCKRDYFLYRAFVDLTNKNNALPHISLPKIFSIVETKSPQDVKALFGSRPYMEFEAGREEFAPIVDIQSELLDKYLARSNFFVEAALASKIKTLNGTVFMEPTPVLEMAEETSPVDIMGVQTMSKQSVPRLRLKVKTYAPWEIYIDPYATNLEEKDGCRYVIKFVLTRLSALRKIYEAGGYPGFDWAKIEGANDLKNSDHYGFQILSEFGLNYPTTDDDIGVLMRYESPERYIDAWNGQFIMRDIDNPYGHGRINLARWIHVQDAHTQNRIWGIGEAKPNEIQSNMLDSLWNSVFRREQIAGQPLIFYREGNVERDDLVWELGNRIPVKRSNADRPIGDSVMIHTGAELPKDQFNLLGMVERNMDMTAGSFSVSRGEQGTGDPTATEIMSLRETGSERQELAVTLGEQVFLKPLAELCVSHIDQFGTMDDYAEMVGPEKAIMLFTANPKNLPGGYSMIFKGSQRVANLLIKQRNLKELAVPLTSLFAQGQFALAKLLLEAHEIPNDEIEQIISDNMQLFQINMQMQMGATSGQPGGRFQENNQKQIAQENAQTVRGA